MLIKKIARSVAVSAIFLVPIFALIVADFFFFPFITGKAFYFRILVEVAFAAWLVLAFMDPAYRPKWTPLTVGVSIFALVTLAADLLGVNPLRSLWSNFERMEGWLVIIHLWAFFVVITNLFGRGDEGKRLWYRWFNFELFIAFVVGLYGVGQLLGWFAIHQGSVRIDASLGNSAYMAVYMLMNAGLAMYMYFIARAGKVGNAGFLKWAYPILAVFFSFLLLETQTRGTILGLLGGIMVALAAYAVFARQASKKSRKISAGIVVGIVLLIGLFIYLRHQPFIQNNEILGRLASISLNSGETTARLYIWNMALTGFTHRPVFGWGQENFNYIFNANYNPHMWSQEQWFDRAHSVYLDWLTASGLVGLLSYLSLYILFLVAVWKSSLSAAEKSVLTGLLAGYAVHNIFVFDNLASYILFFAALAFIDSFKDGQPIRFLGSKPVSIEAAEYVVAPAAIVAFVAVVYFFNVRPIEANTRLISALSNCGQQDDASLFEDALAVNVYLANQEIREQILSCASAAISAQQVPGPTKQALFQLAGQAIQDQVAATPWKDARIYALGGSFMLGINQYDQAKQLLTVAHELSPLKQSISLPLATAMLNLNQADQAVSILKQAYEAATDDTTVRNTYAVALVADGKEAEAHQLFGNDPSVFGTTQMAEAYALAKEYDKAIAIYEALAKANPTDANAAIQLAQAQYLAGLKSDSIVTLQALEKAHPEYKSQVDATIQQIQQGK